ncbi:MAG: HPr family phosphocarrier protein [Planctomycetota bacterium]
MSEPSIEKVVPEEDFSGLLRERAVAVLATCAAPGGSAWTKRRFFDLSVEADELEAFLDDYGARTNRRFSAFTEIVASIRGFALAGMSLTHLVRRLSTYGVLDAIGDRRTAALDDLGMALQFVEMKLAGLMRALLDEGREIGVTELSQGEGQAPVDRTVRRFRLPHNVDLDRIEDEEQRIAEVATKYLDAVEVLRGLQIRRIEDEERRETFMRETCTEVNARVWEATIHNLQSSYDTYVKNTVLETGDPRLQTLRGHISAALHTLEAVTRLTHFVERHERGLRSDMADAVLQRVLPRREVRDVTLNRLLVWAAAFIESGAELAAGLLPSYTNASEATLELREGIHLHARPASLVVAVVQHHGTPVELEVAGTVCNAGSILELMVAIGSNPEAREYVVRGDERPLRDLVALFAADLGESGLEGLPDVLGYLRPG